jgi:hypothetical protein
VLIRYTEADEGAVAARVRGGAGVPAQQFAVADLLPWHFSSLPCWQRWFKVKLSLPTRKRLSSMALARYSFEMNTIKLTFKLEGGLKGTDDDPYNPLARAVNNLFKSGQPFKRLTQCFCVDPLDTITNGSYLLRWFGVFILSAGDRVTFFPGFSSPQTVVQGYQNNSLNWNQSFDFDHFSLEKDFRKWHITNFDSSEHLGSPLTLPLGDGRFLWFGLSMSDFKVLRIAKEQTEINVPVPSSDTGRRSDVFLNSRSNAIFQILDFHPEAVSSIGSGFLHFGIIVGPKDFEMYNGTEIGIPDGSPFLMKPFPNQLVQLPVRIHRFNLSQGIDIQVVTTALSGKLNMPITITSPSRLT